jgi:DNA-binding NtrC family response regulator
LWIELDEHMRSVADEAQRSEDDRILQFLRGLVMARDDRLKKKGFARMASTATPDVIDDTKAKLAQVDEDQKFTNDEVVSRKLLQELETRQAKRPYIALKEVRDTLPVSKMRQEILHLVNNHHVVIISGETGSGKR